MSIREKAINSVVWSAVQTWGSQAGNLLVFFMLVRLLSPEAFGLVALANIFLALMQLFLHQGFTQVLIQRKELDAEHIDTAFWTNLAIGVLLTIIGITATTSIAEGFRQPELAPVLQAFSPLFLMTAFGNVQQALLERKLEFRAIAVRGLAGMLIGGSVGVAMAFCHLGVWSLVGQQLAQEFVGTLVLWIASDWKPKLRFSLIHFQHLFSFGISLLAFNFLNFLSTKADDFLIGYFLGSSALGYYSIAYRILGIMIQLLVNTGQQVALPTLSRLQEEPERFRKAFYAATQLTSLFAFPSFLGVAVLAPEIIVLLFGQQWIPSVPVMQILSLAGIFKAVNFLKGSVFVAIGQPAWTLWLGLLNTALNLIGFMIAMRWGIVAVAAAYVIRGYLVFPVSQWLMSRVAKISSVLYLRQIVVPLSASMVMIAAIAATKILLQDVVNLPLMLLISTGIGAIVYGISIRFFSPSLFQQLLELIASVRSAPSRNSAR